VDAGDDDDDDDTDQLIFNDTAGGKVSTIQPIERSSEGMDRFTARVWRVYQQIMVPSLSVCFCFTVTIGLFPSLTVFIESTEKCKSSERFYNDMFVPMLFLLFNLFDFIGRVSAGSFKPIFTDKNIWIGSVARIIFFPLFLLCNMSTNKLANVFTNDAFPLIFMIIFALSNGYVSTNCMVMGASAVSSKDAGLAGTIMILSLTLGLLFGACTSFIVVYISQGKV
jgi:equilibrative nucleoside transporter 1/2/3